MLVFYCFSQIRVAISYLISAATLTLIAAFVAHAFINDNDCLCVNSRGQLRQWWLVLLIDDGVRRTYF